MPSAASAKLDKQVSPEAPEPLRQALIVVLHKIRNLEKRKRKIEQYQEEQKNGKTLNSDQLSAVAKFDEVSCTLENLHEILKQLNTIAVEQTRLQKRLARKDALERAQQDIAKIKEILIVQDVLQNMGQDNVREDFLAGQNGAVQLTEDDLKFLDDLYLEISPKRGEEGLPPIEEQLQQCAEHLLSIVEGKAKDIVGTTYAKLKELIGSIQSCGYFEHTSEETTTELVEEGKAEVQEAAEVIAEEEDAEEEEEDEVETYVTQEHTTVAQSDTTFPKGLIPQQTAPAPAPMPVAAVESSFFTTSAAVSVAFNSQPQPQLQLQPQPTPQPTPLNEFISSGGIDFIQESELDPCDMAILSGPAVPQHPAAIPPPAATPMPVAPIPTQTFTNQSFAAVPNVGHQEVAEPLSIAEQPPLAATTDAGEGWGKLEVEARDWSGGGGSGGGQQSDSWNQPTDTQGDWNQQCDNPGDWAPDQTDSSDWSAQPSDQGDGYITQGGSRNYGARGGRGNRGRGSGSSGGYSGNRGRGNYQNGRGGGGNYGYRNNEGNNYYQQNGYQQRDNYNYGGGGGGGYKRGGASRGGAPRGGERGGPRGGPGGRGGNPRGGRGGGYTRANRQ